MGKGPTGRPGSGWDYRLRPTSSGGTAISVDVFRNAKGPKGMMLGILLSVFGARILRQNMRQVLRSLERG